MTEAQLPQIDREVMRPGFVKYHLRTDPPVALHLITSPDIIGPHDHPGAFTSRILMGAYVERVWNVDGSYADYVRQEGDLLEVEPHHIHEIIALPTGFAMTAVCYDPHVRATRFWQFGEPIMSRLWHEPTFTPLQETR